MDTDNSPQSRFLSYLSAFQKKHGRAPTKNECWHIAWLESAKENQAAVCDVCFTSSWQPCEKEFPDAIKDPKGNGYMVCGYCNLEKLLRGALEHQKEKDARVCDELARLSISEEERLHYLVAVKTIRKGG